MVIVSGFTEVVPPGPACRTIRTRRAEGTEYRLLYLHAPDAAAEITVTIVIGIDVRIVKIEPIGIRGRGSRHTCIIMSHILSSPESNLTQQNSENRRIKTLVISNLQRHREKFSNSQNSLRGAFLQRICNVCTCMLQILSLFLQHTNRNARLWRLNLSNAN